jgi:hypothetical protein
MATLFGGTIHSALVHAVTEYDRKESTKKYYNHYALGQYLIRIEQVEEDIASGTAVRAALLAGFNGRLLDHVLKAVGEPKFTTEEMRSQSYVYHGKGN